MKITDEKLNQLIAQKQAQTASSPPDEDRMRQRFSAAIAIRKPAPRRWPRRAAAASLAIIAGAAAWMLFIPSPAATCDPLSEASRLFGNDSALALFDGSLLIGERLGKGTPVHRFCLEIVDRINGKVRTMVILASDDDTLILSGEISGEIIISRSDRNTFVADINLSCADQQYHNITVIKTS